MYSLHLSAEQLEFRDTVRLLGFDYAVGVDSTTKLIALGAGGREEDERGQRVWWEEACGASLGHHGEPGTERLGDMAVAARDSLACFVLGCFAVRKPMSGEIYGQHRVPGPVHDLRQ